MIIDLQENEEAYLSFSILHPAPMRWLARRLDGWYGYLVEARPIKEWEIKKTFGHIKADSIVYEYNDKLYFFVARRRYVKVAADESSYHHKDRTQTGMIISNEEKSYSVEKFVLSDIKSPQYLQQNGWRNTFVSLKEEK